MKVIVVFKIGSVLVVWRIGFFFGELIGIKSEHYLFYAKFMR